jgi:ferredoxin-NADP reductase
LEAHGPLGGFTPETQENCAVVPKYLFLAAGSGITPLMSITRALLGSPGRSDVVLLNSIHSPSDLIFGAELLALPTGGGMRVEVICSSADRYGLATGVPASPGRLNPGLLRRLVPDLTEREVFCCGPPGYLAAVRAMLEEAGCDPRRRHEESFEIGDQPGAQPGGGTAPPPVPAQAPAGFAVEFARTGRTIDCGPETIVLDAALAAGVMLPSSCGQGLCGTCKSDLLRGTVEMNHAGGIRPREIAQGKILICCSTPTADLVIDA